MDKSDPIPISLCCRSYIKAKAYRAPFPSYTEKRTEKFGDLIHTDVWGSPNVRLSPGGNQYFILFIDDFTRYITVKLMKNKMAQRIRSNNAAEYQGTRSWLEERGIQ